MCDIMHHLTSCSKAVQTECTFSWMFIESIYSCLITLTVVMDSLDLPNLLNGSLNKLLFPQFSECSILLPIESIKIVLYLTYQSAQSVHKVELLVIQKIS